MKHKIYITPQNVNISAGEHAYPIDHHLTKDAFLSKEEYISHFLKNEWHKLSSLQLLTERILVKNYKNVLSLGAGQGVLEYLLKLTLSREHKIVSSDFDPFFVEKAKEFFPEIRSVKFNFFQDSIKDIEKKD